MTNITALANINTRCDIQTSLCHKPKGSPRTRCTARPWPHLPPDLTAKGMMRRPSYIDTEARAGLDDAAQRITQRYMDMISTARQNSNHGPMTSFGAGIKGVRALQRLNN